MRVSVVVLEDFGVLGYWGSTKEDGSLDIWHVFAETGVLLADLVGQFTSVAHDQYRSLAGNGLNLLKGSEYEDSGLSETRLGLTEDIGSEDGLWNANLLDCGSIRSQIGFSNVFRLCASSVQFAAQI